MQIQTIHDVSEVASGPEFQNSSEYEEVFSTTVGSRFAISFAFARTALWAILQALKVKRGDEVVLSPLTCKVVPLTLLSLGIRPIFADISGTTLNLNSDSVQSKISGRTKAILFQHTYGNNAGIADIQALADSAEIPLIEDRAQCLPVKSEDEMPSANKSAAIYSNNLLKPLPAASGGVAVANNAELATSIQNIRDELAVSDTFSDVTLRIRILSHRLLLWPRLYWSMYGLNRLLSSSYSIRDIEIEIENEIHDCAKKVSLYQRRTGLRWLEKVENLERHRLRCCERYRERLGFNKHTGSKCKPLYYYPVFVNQKSVLLRIASRKRVEVVGWPIKTPIYPIEQVEMLSSYGYTLGSCSVAETVASRLIGLPTHHRISDSALERIVSLLNNSAEDLEAVFVN